MKSTVFALSILLLGGCDDGQTRPDQTRFAPADATTTSRSPAEAGNQPADTGVVANRDAAAVQPADAQVHGGRDSAQPDSLRSDRKAGFVCGYSQVPISEYVPCCLPGTYCPPTSCDCAENAKSEDPTLIHCIRSGGERPTLCWDRKQ